VLPIGAFFIKWLVDRRTNAEWAKMDFRRAFVSYLLSFFATLGTTVCFKKIVGRPRPNALALGKWNGTHFTADEVHINEAFQSFPSGHASLSFATLGFLTFYLCSILYPPRMKPIPEQYGHAWRAVVAITPAFLAMWVAVTRIRDYFHNPDDILGGILIGSAWAWLCFRYYYLSGLQSAMASMKDQTPPSSVPLLHDASHATAVAPAAENKQPIATLSTSTGQQNV
jgi:diacylglycerol diphosphate phosphatase/phosphatidate phosphatase